MSVLYLKIIHQLLLYGSSLGMCWGNCIRLKKRSKRLGCKKKYKIQPKKKGSKGEKPISVPNKCPFKEDPLKEAETRRKQLKDELQEKKRSCNEESIKEKKKQQKKIAKKTENLTDEFFTGMEIS
ncbi:CP-type G domain-containing protein [Meloidogyne graminicola]|uniref:CP-type G domain-containing protein n=1 Tax=Meloidogyne graminicola TaxID=189291 RepID=A0A8S9ZJ36_9BILA|nr:CP-type G domain-containing protein [Meloidogyne graminicola]